MLDDESDDIFMLFSLLLELLLDLEDESVDFDDVIVILGVKGKSDFDVNKFLEGIDEKIRIMFEVLDVDLLKILDNFFIVFLCMIIMFM